MKTEKIRLAIKRDIRHAPYNVTQCTAEIVVRLDDEEELTEELFAEAKEDVQLMVTEMANDETRRFEDEITFTRNKNKRR